MTLPLRTNEVKGVKLLVRFCQKTLASKKGIQNWSFEVNISDSDRSWPYLSLCLSARLHMFAPQESAFFARFLTSQIWTHNFCLKLFERLISREPVVPHRFYVYLGLVFILGPWSPETLMASEKKPLGKKNCTRQKWGPWGPYYLRITKTRLCPKFLSQPTIPLDYWEGVPGTCQMLLTGYSQGELLWNLGQPRYVGHSRVFVNFD